MTSVLLVDDHALVRAGFAMILEVEEDVQVVGAAEDGAEAMRLVRELNPDVVLMDVQMPGTDGISATAEITATSAGAMELTGTLIGRAAVARTDLRPSGFITVDGQDVAATSEHGAYVQAGTAVEVIALRFGEAVVRPRPGASA